MYFMYYVFYVLCILCINKKNKLCLSRCKASKFFMEELESKTAKLKVFQCKQIVFVKFRKSNYVDSNNSLIVHDVLLSQ